MTFGTWKDHWHREGGVREMLRLSFPLILSNSFWTLQVTIDRIFLARYDTDAVAAAMAAVLLFWTPMALFQQTSGYCTTFVAQYVGAGRPHRVGPAVWQAIYFSIISGLLFLLAAPFAPSIVGIGFHEDHLQVMEATYFQCLCFAALPTILTAAVCAFFAGRGDSWTVLVINATGFIVNASLDYGMIYGAWGFPEMGIAGAGWATVIGCWSSVLVGLVLMFRPQFQAAYSTLSGWRLDRDLFYRLMRFGLPNGLQWAIDGVAFTVFVLIVGRIGPVELAATSIAFTINMTAVMPTLGISQAIEILVGQRLGQNRPDLAERSTWTGFRLAWLWMATIGVLYFVVPSLFLLPFQNDDDPAKWEQVAALVRILLRFVAVYCLFDSMNMAFTFALKGAGDTRYVSIVAIGLSWPLMVIPTYLTFYYDLGHTATIDWRLYLAWSYATTYIIAVAFVFLFRFMGGKWKSMRVIEHVPATALDELRLDDEQGVKEPWGSSSSA